MPAIGSKTISPLRKGLHLLTNQNYKYFSYTKANDLTQLSEEPKGKTGEECCIYPGIKSGNIKDINR